MTDNPVGAVRSPVAGIKTDGRSHYLMTRAVLQIRTATEEHQGHIRPPPQSAKTCRSRPFQHTQPDTSQSPHFLEEFLPCKRMPGRGVIQSRTGNKRSYDNLLSEKTGKGSARSAQCRDDCDDAPGDYSPPF